MAINVNNLHQGNNYRVARPKVETEYSSLKKAYTIQGTGDMGLLIPICVQELVPSQKINLSQEVAVQFNPFVSNLFHEINGEVMKFVVPMRLLWEEWETFIIGGLDGKDNTVHPTMDLNKLYEKSSTVEAERTLVHTVADYIGMPINSSGVKKAGALQKPSAMPWYAYNKVYNDHIRIIDMEKSEVPKDNNELLRGNWDHDYFTRSRIAQQRGVIPTVPIDMDNIGLEVFKGGVLNKDTGINMYSADWVGDTGMASQVGSDKKAEGRLKFSNNSKELYEIEVGVGLKNQTKGISMNLNDLTVALSVMRYQVNNIKVQPRYIDQLEIRWGVYPEDARMNRSEYLGSEYISVLVDTVTQTSEGVETKQGNITAQGWANGRGIGTDYVAKEHCMLITLLIVKPKTVYEGGLNKSYVRNNRFDYATPEMNNLPDVPILNSELAYTNVDLENKKIFGWQGIYEEYRTETNIVAGKMRPSEKGNLVSFTLARWFETAPLLNKEFVGCNPDQKRILQYSKEPCMNIFIRNNINTAIPLPYQSEPGEIGIL